MKNIVLHHLAVFLFLLSASALSHEQHKYRIDVWADNWFAAYIDGKALLEDSVSITSERSFNAETLTFTAADSFSLAFIIKDFKENDTGLEYIGSNRQQIGDGGFITQITNLDTGKVVGVSNSNMRCTVIHKAPLNSRCASQAKPVAGEGDCQFISTEKPSLWNTPRFDDSAWPQAAEYSAAQVRPKHGYNNIKWDSRAKLIWTDDLEKDNTLLCRLAIDNSTERLNTATLNTTTSTKRLTTESKHKHAELHVPFTHFSNVNTYEDSNYLHIESNGLPEHNMMVGITSWQQQVPLPQDYTGNNTWKIPLKPVLADKPMLSKDHFHRGAIAIAVNGVPIFNALNNRGEYSADIGELDKWGGHSGRADDYHYHLAPVHLENIVGKDQPIAYALDGFPVYGKTDKPLDKYLGRFIEEGKYQYHAVDYPPYLIAGLRGEVTVDSLANAPEDQIEPQAKSQAIRQGDYRPLKGASITSFEKTGAQSYALEYLINSQLHHINYNWDEQGNYRFVFVDAAGKRTVENYQKGNEAPREKPINDKAQAPKKYCGDGICDETENSQMCASDCSAK